MKEWICGGELFPNEVTEHQAAGTTLSHFDLSARPNPFNPSTILGFSLSEWSDVRLEVYGTAGREVLRLAEGRLDAGEQEARFDGARLPSGIYFARMMAGDRAEILKLVLLK